MKYKKLTSLYTTLSFPIYNVKYFLHIHLEPHETIITVALTLFYCALFLMDAQYFLLYHFLSV